MFDRAAAADPAAVAARYAALAAPGFDGCVVEKLPMNYLYLGAIHRALPQSRLLLVTRSPPDSCFAMYRTLFGEAYPFSYDFDDLARYYAAYARLMTHWRLTLGDAVHEISYEQLVTDPVHAGSRAAAMCGLAWKDSAIELEKNSTVSLTASAAQARRPIYTTSLGRWRHYRAHLAPLVERLRRLQVPFSSDV